MTTDKISNILATSSSGEEAIRYLRSAGIQVIESQVADAWSEVRTLKRQSAELNQLLPNRHDIHRRQFWQQVHTVASRLHTELFDIGA